MAQRVLDHLNKKRQEIKPGCTGYKTVDIYTTARLRNYTEEDLKTVIDYKAREWATLISKDGRPMFQFLRQQTLFAPSHFDTYLVEAKEYSDESVRDEYEEYAAEMKQNNSTLPYNQRTQIYTFQQWLKVRNR
jgi:uncharacterized phage protein (TIGR02220 family)